MGSQESDTAEQLSTHMQGRFKVEIFYFAVYLKLAQNHKSTMPPEKFLTTKNLTNNI